MKSRLFVLTWAFLLSFVASWAQQVGFYVDDGFKIQQGGQATLSIGLQNDIDICGVQMHLYLPDGITIAEELNEDEEMAPAVYMSNRKKSQHVLYIYPTADGATQIVIAGVQAFRNNTGEILSIKLNVDPSVALGSYNILMKNLAFSDINAISYEQDNIIVPVRVFTAYQISAVSSDETKGSVSLTNGGAAVENGTSVVASATPVEGYEFVNWQVDGVEKSTANPYIFTAAENVSLVATFRPLKYNVVFSVDGVETTSSLDYASVIPTPTAPSKTGYTFTGWEPAFEEGATVPLNGITYTAQWQVNQYTFTFDSNGGSDVAAITQDYGTAVTAPANPTREGYTFTGWDKEFPANMPATNMTFTAQWQVNQYTFTFDSNGGSDVAAITQDYGTAVTAPANPTREGYTFTGWDKEFPANMPASDMTFTAQWQVNQYTFTFDSNGGSDVAAITQDYATAVTVPANPTREGYTFTGWDKAIPETMPASDMTFTAQWQVNQYTFTFDSNGGSEVATITQDYATAVTAPANPTREGYTFTGWDKEIPANMPATNMTFTAQWQVNQYTFTFDSNGGSEVAAITQDYATAVTVPANPTREGYTFAGWDKEIPANMPATNMTFTAQWQINQYTLTFDSNGGSDVAVITQDYGTAVTAPANPTREGYTFAGWDKEIPANMPATNMTFTAQWQVNQYTFTFDSNGGSDVAAITQDYGTAVTAPANPTREGYTFTGWDKEIPANMPATNMTFTAQWQINQYTLTFDSNGGSEVAAITQDYGTAVTAPANPTREGYTFAGWDKEIPANMPASDMTFIAQWQVNQYKVTFLSENDVVSEGMYDYGSAITAPVPTREGYTFTGWSPEVDATVPAHDVSYTAQWQINQYKVTFQADGNTVSEQTLDYGSSITVPEAPAKEGYTFTGWSPEVDATVPAHDVTYTANYEVNYYRLTYYIGNEVVYTEEVAYGTAIEPYQPEVPEGYEFKGWTDEVPATMPAHDVEIHGDFTIMVGIQKIVVEAGGSVEVYNLQGQLVKRISNAAELRHLPTGVYLINGKKVVKR